MPSNMQQQVRILTILALLLLHPGLVAEEHEAGPASVVVVATALPEVHGEVSHR